MSQHDFDTLTVQVADDIQLVVREFRNQEITATLYLGEFPEGRRLSFTTVYGDAKVHVEATGMDAPCLWFGSTAIDLPWLELLKVADFLRLEIPLPVPLGEQVPA